MTTKPVPATAIAAIRRNLVEFGYTVSLDQVAAQVDLIRQGKPDSDLTIIGRFAKTMLREAGYLEVSDVQRS